MSALSTFQCLPLHIAESIVRYCISGGLNRDRTVTKLTYEKYVWTTLYDVSSSWRALAIKFFLKEATLRIEAASGTGQFEFRSLPGEIKLDGIRYDLVKHVFIDFADFLDCIGFDGVNDKTTTVKYFSSAWPESVSFPSARQLSVDLSGLLFQSSDEHSTSQDERFSWITRRIQTSLPKLQQVTLSDIKFYYALSSELAGYRWKADKFLSSFFGKITKLSLRTCTVQLTSRLPLLQNATGLTRLDYECDSNDSLPGYLFRQSAQTLQSLRLTNMRFQTVLSLILDDNNVSIIYPRLQILEVDNLDSSTNGSKLLIDKSIAPFPVLRCLKWNMVYIFEDDTLFRKNGGTLEYLDIEVDTELAAILQKHQVFADGKYSRLGHVSVRIIGCDFSAPLEPDLFIRFAISLIATETRSLSLFGYYLFNESVKILAEIPRLENIQVLCLAMAELEIHELFDLVKILPNLTKLTCTPACIELDSGSEQLSDYVDGLHARYYPLSRQFKHWEVLLEHREHVRPLAFAALEFTILCTRFASVTVPSFCREMIGLHINELVDSGFYNSHLDKIQCLLRNMGCLDSCDKIASC